MVAMVGFLALVFPVLLLAFVLVMERVESPLRRESEESTVQDFLESASPDDVDTFVREGVASAIAARRRRGPLRLPRRRGAGAGSTARRGTPVRGGAGPDPAAPGRVGATEAEPGVERLRP